MHMHARNEWEGMRDSPHACGGWGGCSYSMMRVAIPIYVVKPCCLLLLLLPLSASTPVDNVSSFPAHAASCRSRAKWTET